MDENELKARGALEIAMQVQERYPPQATRKNGASRAVLSGGAPKFWHLTRNTRTFRHQYDMIRFVKSARSEDDVDFVIGKLGDPNAQVHNMLRDVLQVEMSVDAGNRVGLYSFQRLIMPLVTLLADARILSGPNIRGALAIYTAVLAEGNFLLKGINCLHELAQRRSVQDLGFPRASEERSMTSDVEWMRDYVLPFCRLVFAMLSRVSDAPAEDQIHQATMRLLELMLVWSTPRGERYGDEARQYVKRSRTILDDARRYEVARARAMQFEVTTPEMEVHHLMCSRRSRSESSADVTDPGQIHPDELTWQDNDLEFFREPSMTRIDHEVLCTAEPYIPVLPQPSSRGGAVGVLGVSPLREYVDAQFSSKGGDILDSFRDAVRTFLKKGALERLAPGQTTVPIPGAMEETELRMDVFRNLHFRRLVPRANFGMCVEVEFDAPAEITHLRSKKSHERFWTLREGSRRLQYCSLVCALTRVGGQLRMEFGWVAERNTDDLVGHGDASKRPRIILKMAGSENPRLLEYWKPRDDAEVVLLQLRVHCSAAYNSVHRVLKLHTAATMPVQREIISQGSSPEERSAGLPAQVDNEEEFDLSCLLKTQNSNLKRVLVNDYKVLQKRLRSCGKNLMLDGSQIDAVASALSTNVSLIQGPPGTGKSFVGVHIVRALLANRAQAHSRGPILCLAHTNHALDQFLEQLVEAGVPLEELVRVGNGAKSPVLRCRNLTTLIRYERNSNRRQEFDGLKDLMGKVEELFQELRCTLNKELKWNCIEPLLEKRYSRHWRQLTHPLNAQQPDPGQTECDKTWSAKDAEFPMAGGLDRFTEQQWTAWCNGDDIKDDVNVRGQQAGHVEQTVNHCAALRELDENVGSSDGSLLSDTSDEDEPTAAKDVEPPRAQNDQVARGVPGSSDRPLPRLLSGRVNMWHMSLGERQKLVDAWTAEARAEVQRELSRLLRRYDEVSERLRAVDECSARVVLEGQSVVACTTSSAAKYINILRSVGAHVIVCDEAREVFESQILASLTAETQRLIIIGGYLQLQPKLNTARRLRNGGHGYELVASRFERQVSHEIVQSLPPVATMLLSQRRMHPKIAEIMRRTLYPQLEDTGPVVAYPDVRGFMDNLFFLDHNHLEAKGSTDNSYVNTFEAKMVVELVKYIVQQDYKPSQVAVVTPYSGQLLTLRNMLQNEHLMLALSDHDAADIERLERKAKDVDFLVTADLEDSDPEDGDYVPNPGPSDESGSEEGDGSADLVDGLHAEDEDYVADEKQSDESGSEDGEGFEDLLDGLYAEGEDSAEDHGERDESGNEETGDNAPQGRRRGHTGAQRQKDRRCLHVAGVARQRFNLQDRVRLATVDNFQGAEAEIVVVSTVRCNKAGRAGLLKTTNQVTGMLSRAKHGMYILGSRDTVRKSTESRMFNAVLDYLETEGAIGPSFALRCQNHRHVTHVASPRDFEGVRDGGCSQICGQRLPCGHGCVRMCHPDKVHDGSQCRELCWKMLECGHPCGLTCRDECGGCSEPCTKTLECGHPCPRTCSEPCGGCSERVTFKMQCGHVAAGVECARRDHHVCRERVHADMLMCEHLGEAVECWRAQKMHKLRAAGRVNLAECDSDTEELLQACNSKCSRPRDCEHVCEQRCGDCAMLSVQHSSDLKLPAWVERTTHAGQCSRRCDRDLICGHRCSGVCCADGDCPPCERRCTTRCEHSKCGRQCNETCSTCAYDCPWSCTHGAGQCPLPCVSPCVRLPCDVRCNKPLETCGHPCPSVCGEECPSSAYCRECILAAGSAPDAGPTSKYAERVVDLVTFRRLKEHDPDTSPLIVLPCGHCYTVETLDGRMELTSVYERSADGQGWSGTRPLTSSGGGVMASCPDCRMPIRGVRRYGRVVNSLVLANLERRFRARSERNAKEVRSAFQAARARAIAIAENAGTDPIATRSDANRETIAQVENEMLELANACEQAMDSEKFGGPMRKYKEVESRFWVDPRFEEQRRRFTAAEGHQPILGRDQPPLVTWLMLQVTVLDGFMRVHALRPEVSTYKVTRIVRNADLSLSKLNWLCSNLELERWVQDVRLLSAQFLIGNRHLAAKICGGALGDVDELYTEIKRTLDEAEARYLTEAQAVKLEALRSALEVQAKDVRRLELRMVADAMRADLEGSGAWYECGYCSDGDIFVADRSGYEQYASGICSHCSHNLGHRKSGAPEMRQNSEDRIPNCFL